MVCQVKDIVRSLRRVLLLAVLISKTGFQAWTTYIASAVLNLWLLFLFMLIGYRTFGPHILIGAIMSTIFSTCLGSALIDAYYGLLRFRDFLLVSPLSTYELRLGISLGHLLPSMAMCIPYIMLLALNVQDPLKILGSLCILVPLTWITASIMGYTITSRDVFSAGRMVNLITSIMVYLPPIYYPPTLLPHCIRYLAFVVPTFNIAQLAKIALGIEHISSSIIVIHIAALMLETMALVIIARIRIKYIDK